LYSPFEAIIVRLLGYCIFWDADARHAFRENARPWARRIAGIVGSYSESKKPREQGGFLVEERIKALGITVSRRQRVKEKVRVALLVDEFFGAWDTAIGGYGALARKYVCRYVPNDQIEIDVLLNFHDGEGALCKAADNTKLYWLPVGLEDRKRWMDGQRYDLFLSIEMTSPSFDLIKGYDLDVPFLFWIQDPRELDAYQARLRSVNRLRDDDWSYSRDVSSWLQSRMRRGLVSFISQGESLSQIARKAYNIPEQVPIALLRNPIDMDFDYKLDVPPKQNKIVFLARLEAQKRAWIACEIAKAMPQYEFYILGATGKGRDELQNARSLGEYRNPDGSSKIANLHFVGHVDGDVKNEHLKSAKLLINTSIWEGIPVSWLEALSYGTLIVSAFDRDDIVSRFGCYIGEVLGDGVDDASIRRFARAIEYWMTHDATRLDVGRKAIDFVRKWHSVDEFRNSLRAAILTRARQIS
jgi:glycosyltransferase involved in cell wall biosynthesis